MYKRNKQPHLYLTASVILLITKVLMFVALQLGFTALGLTIFLAHMIATTKMVNVRNIRDFQYENQLQL
ncbi:MAG: hypothetical protein DUD28_10070 [Lactobacillus sp.]|nr:MAG: hypothetical protein DUD28_10070 [Lactobacillus sp.]